jgi:hypothetical protein
MMIDANGAAGCDNLTQMAAGAIVGKSSRIIRRTWR